jgi:hypothetical protein
MKEIDYKKKFKELINNSRLKPDQKELWYIFIEIAKPHENEAVYEAASGSDEDLNLLTNNLRDKIWAMKDGSKEAWDKVIDEEEKILDELDDK